MNVNDVITNRYRREGGVMKELASNSVPVVDCIGPLRECLDITCRAHARSRELLDRPLRDFELVELIDFPDVLVLVADQQVSLSSLSGQYVNSERVKVLVEYIGIDDFLSDEGSVFSIVNCARDVSIFGGLLGLLSLVTSAIAIRLSPQSSPLSIFDGDDPPSESSLIIIAISFSVFSFKS